MIRSVWHEAACVKPSLELMVTWSDTVQSVISSSLRLMGVRGHLLASCWYSMLLHWFQGRIQPSNHQIVHSFISSFRNNFLEHLEILRLKSNVIRDIVTAMTPYSYTSYRRKHFWKGKTQSNKIIVRVWWTKCSAGEADGAFIHYYTAALPEIFLVQ